MPGVPLLIGIKSADGRYLRANDDGSVSFCKCNIMDPNIRFVAPASLQVFLQSYKREFVSLTKSNDLKLIASTNPVGLNETFNVVLRGANKISVIASNKKYVTCDGNDLKVTSDSITDNETFEVIHLYI